MTRFKDKKYIVTGGTSGIGLATAKRLKSEGAAVMVTGTNPERLAAAEATGLIALRNDAGDPGAAAELGKAVESQFGTIDGAFLNAGLGRFMPLEQVSAEEFDAQFNVNVRGPLLHAQTLAPLVNEGGALLLNTSVGREKGLAGASIYTATKGALRTLVRVLATEMSARNIRVNAVSPGPIESNFMARTGMPEEAMNQFAQQIISQVPLGRFGKAEEVAAVASFLLSTDASYVTGSEYKVDGGMTEV